KGDRCDEPIIDLCIGQSKISCDNKATCVTNSCKSFLGFGGERCENIVPLRGEHANSRCNTSCAAVFANMKCDENCNTAECFYDGLDCYEKPEIDEEEYSRMDLGSTNYLFHYGNGVCDKDCNSYQYGFDGGECEK
ncbi:hypothetical protein PMAYCL1PPCAC_00084, partial [Pristionchus mayeri]